MHPIRYAAVSIHRILPLLLLLAAAACGLPPTAPLTPPTVAVDTDTLFDPSAAGMMDFAAYDYDGPLDFLRHAPDLR